ncbi:hypothetical protein B0T14DRAFT_514363 [Immersiella caudata]|uniref:Uncharacterized protein n=1 Tax=Immersiella caudata TaxID=314043 RepID=A0AA39WW95_9PEZI|nr:hypothetical protein B0T14DRAFT_514363 [Immersiella caudata]
MPMFLPRRFPREDEHMRAFRRDVAERLHAQHDAHRARRRQLQRHTLPLPIPENAAWVPPHELLVRLGRLSASVAREGLERVDESSAEDTPQRESPTHDSDDLFGGGEQPNENRSGEDENERGENGGENGDRDEDEEEDQYYTEDDEADINARLLPNPDAHKDNDNDYQDKNDETEADYFEDAEEAAAFDDIFNEGWNEGYSHGFANIMTVYTSVWYSKTSTRFLLDFIFGFCDGLSIPFFLAAGLASLNVPVAMVVLADLVQILAGCFNKIVAECTAPSGDLPGNRTRLVRDVTLEKGSPKAGRAAKALEKTAFDWVTWAPSYAFMKRAEAASMMVTPPRDQPAYLPLLVGSCSALGYLLGSLLPLLPYFFAEQVHCGLVTSIGIHLFVSFGFAFARRYYVVGPASWDVASNWRRKAQRGMVDGVRQVIVGVFTASLAVICAKTSAWAFGLLPSGVPLPHV